jgi:hippurate hydrolase
VLTVGSLQAGTENNVIPTSALLKINLRWYDEKDRDTMLNGIERISRSIAAAGDIQWQAYRRACRSQRCIPDFSKGTA